MSYSKKIVVFDLDETLGNFVELGMFCDALENFNGTSLSTEHFFQIIDLFKECLRPDILKILKYLISRKKNNKCKKIMIYTNNQGPREWTENISKYFENKLNTTIFDNIVAAFKVRGQRIEMGRTSHDKIVNDLINCTKIPRDTQICFLDDQYHPQMKHENVYYIHLKPYVYEYEFTEMAQRYFSNYKHKLKDTTQKEDFEKFITEYMGSYDCDKVIKKTPQELKIDKIISKKILQHLHKFFNEKHNITHKNNKKHHKNHKNHTKKNYT